LTDWQRDFAPFQSGCGILDDAEMGELLDHVPVPVKASELRVPVRDVAMDTFSGCGGLLVGVEGMALSVRGSPCSISGAARTVIERGEDRLGISRKSSYRKRRRGGQRYWVD
jgi:hypothetical protein